MSFTVVIPARMKSSRLPEKPLKLIAGKPMVVRVAEAAIRSRASRIVVATDHPLIEAVCNQYGVEVVMTKESHPTGTDRLAEAVVKLGLSDKEIVVNVQGDEPLMPPEAINKVAALLIEKPKCAIATAAHPITDVDSFKNPNVVKVVRDFEGNALNFSRSPIPYPRDEWRTNPELLPSSIVPLHHLGLYAYRVGFLRRFPTLDQAPIEKAESLEQLRALFYGEKIAVTVFNKSLPAGVDTEEDLQRVIQIFKKQDINK